MTNQECGEDYREYDPCCSGSAGKFAYADAAESEYGGGSCRSQNGQNDQTGHAGHHCQDERCVKTAWDCLTNSRIKVKKNGRTIAKVPASLGIAGVIGCMFSRKMAVVGAIGLAGALSAGYCMELDVKKPH